MSIQTCEFTSEIEYFQLNNLHYEYFVETVSVAKSRSSAYQMFVGTQMETFRNPNHTDFRQNLYLFRLRMTLSESSLNLFKLFTHRKVHTLFYSLLNTNHVDCISKNRCVADNKHGNHQRIHYQTNKHKINNMHIRTKTTLLMRCCSAHWQANRRYRLQDWKARVWDIACELHCHRRIGRNNYSPLGPGTFLLQGKWMDRWLLLFGLAVDSLWTEAVALESSMKFLHKLTSITKPI